MRLSLTLALALAACFVPKDATCLSVASVSCLFSQLPSLVVAGSDAMTFARVTLVVVSAAAEDELQKRACVRHVKHESSVLAREGNYISIKYCLCIVSCVDNY